mmetsp:Transcript_115642/g.211781  ORF Transcript_115642/g.211781 Transcript_115642/m.211781 type:complete len:202 (+) Transcript_115642:195-800(+)
MEGPAASASTGGLVASVIGVSVAAFCTSAAWLEAEANGVRACTKSSRSMAQAGSTRCCTHRLRRVFTGILASSSTVKRTLPRWSLDPPMGAESSFADAGIGAANASLDLSEGSTALEADPEVSGLGSGAGGITAATGIRARSRSARSTVPAGRTPCCVQRVLSCFVDMAPSSATENFSCGADIAASCRAASVKRGPSHKAS